MPTENKYDYIIIGAGCAGLSLAYRLLNKNYRICILESNRNVNVINKLWSFWDTKKTPFNHLVKKRWKSLTITNDTESINILMLCYMDYHQLIKDACLMLGLNFYFLYACLQLDIQIYRT